MRETRGDHLGAGSPHTNALSLSISGVPLTTLYRACPQAVTRNTLTA